MNCNSRAKAAGGQIIGRFRRPTEPNGLFAGSSSRHRRPLPEGFISTNGTERILRGQCVPVFADGYRTDLSRPKVSAERSFDGLFRLTNKIVPLPGREAARTFLGGNPIARHAAYRKNSAGHRPACRACGAPRSTARASRPEAPRSSGKRLRPTRRPLRSFWRH